MLLTSRISDPATETQRTTKAAASPGSLHPKVSTMLRDYEPKDWTTDQFSLNQDAQGNPRWVVRPYLDFPCCVCKHGDKEQNDDPALAHAQKY